MNYALIKMAVIVLAIFAFIYGIINVKTHLKKTLENPKKMDMKKFKRHYYLSFILTFIEAFIIGRSCDVSYWNARWRFRRICI